MDAFEKPSLASNLHTGLAVIERMPPLALGKLLSGARGLFYPSHCAACGCRLQETLREETLCEACSELIVPLAEHHCPVCSHPMQGIFQCPNCDGQRWHLSVIVAGCRYEGLARDLIQRFKYGRDQSLMRALGDLMLPALTDPRLLGKSFDAIVPVPLHPLREREREFNQSALLAKRVARHLNLSVESILKRTRDTMHQAGFDRLHRLKNLEKAFAIRKPFLEGASILLVDDVTTTGTTLNACASVLMESGADEVCAVTVARG